MLHYFDPLVAAEVGVNAAVIFQNIYHWVEKNRANNVHFHDGRYWTYNSLSAFSEMFPYLTQKQVRTAIQKLKSVGYIISGNYNKVGFDHTTWYALTDAGYAVLSGVKGQIEPPEKADGQAQTGKSESPEKANQNCPDGRTNTRYKPYINTNINTNTDDDLRNGKSKSKSREKLSVSASENLSEKLSGNDPELARAMAELLNLIPQASPMAMDELRGFYADMGADVCIRAIWIARDERNPSWAYIRGILRNRQSQGVRSIADWDRIEAQWQNQKKGKSGGKPPNPEQERSWSELAEELERGKFT